MIDRRPRRRRDGKTYTVYRVRWWDGDRQRSKTFDRASDAQDFEAKIRTLKRADSLADLDAGKETLAEFAQEWWRTFAAANLERSSLHVYAGMWNKHAEPRLGHLRLRDLSPKVIAQVRAELEAEGVGPEAIRKTMAMLQGILQRAVEWERLRSNAVRVVRKPPAKRQRAIRPLPPAMVEALRSVLLERGQQRDATLISVLAYAGLRPQEALALTWGHIRERTLLVEHAVSGGELKGQKTGKPPRTVTLLAPLKHDLAEWRFKQGRPPETALVFPVHDGGPWRAHDWRNWRRRASDVAADAIGLESSRPYDVRHSFASLLIHERRLSNRRDRAADGHNPNVCLSTYAHVMAELETTARRAQGIRFAPRARKSLPSRSFEAKQVAQMWSRKRIQRSRRPRKAPISSKPSGGLEPPTPSLPWMGSWISSTRQRWRNLRGRPTRHARHARVVMRS